MRVACLESVVFVVCLEWSSPPTPPHSWYPHRFRCLFVIPVSPSHYSINSLFSRFYRSHAFRSSYSKRSSVCSTSSIYPYRLRSTRSALVSCAFDRRIATMPTPSFVDSTLSRRWDRRRRIIALRIFMSIERRVPNSMWRMRWRTVRMQSTIVDVLLRTMNRCCYLRIDVSAECVCSMQALQLRRTSYYFVEKRM